MTSLREHLLAIPGTTDEMLQAKADKLRRNCSDKWLGSQTDPIDLFLTAVLDAYPPLPQPVQVGHLATTKYGNEGLVLSIDGDEAWLRWANGYRNAKPLASLTYSRPCPEGWGQ